MLPHKLLQHTSSSEDELEEAGEKANYRILHVSLAFLLNQAWGASMPAGGGVGGRHQQYLLLCLWSVLAWQPHHLPLRLFDLGWQLLHSSRLSLGLCLMLPTELAARVPAELKAMLAGIGQAVAALHDGGLIHGDLTTSNMLVREVDGTVVSTSQHLAAELPGQICAAAELLLPMQQIHMHTTCSVRETSSALG